MKVTSVVGLERPLFGQAVRQLVGLRSDVLESCLEQQRQVGGRLGEILRSRGLLTSEQILDVLRYQAQAVAGAMQADLKPYSFPYPTYFSLCMPAFNEEANIRDTLDAACAILPEFVQDFEIVVVNDGSRDATADLVRKYGEKELRVRLVNHEVNRGYGAAVTSGLKAARGDLIAFTDSDGQFSFLDLPQLLVRMKGADVVVGYRYQRADNWLRCFNARCWNWLIRTVLAVQIEDLDCAFKLFRREVIDQLQMSAQGAAINAEIMAQVCRGGWVVRETPVTHYPRYYGAPTGAAVKVIMKAFRELPRLLKYRFAAYPAGKVPDGATSSETLPMLNVSNSDDLMVVAVDQPTPLPKHHGPSVNGHGKLTAVRD